MSEKDEEHSKEPARGNQNDEIERLKRKLKRARGRLEAAQSRITQLEAECKETKEELEAMKAVVQVYDDHRPKSSELKSNDQNNSDSEDFEEDIESFDKTNTRDDGHLPRPKASKSTNQFEGTETSNKSTHISGHSRSGSEVNAPTASSATKNLSQNTLSGSGNHKTSEDGEQGKLKNDSSKLTHSNASNTVTSSAARPKRRDVPLAVGANASASRKYHTTRETTRDLGVNLSKADELELFGQRQDGLNMDWGAPRTPRMSTETSSTTVSLSQNPLLIPSTSVPAVPASANPGPTLASSGRRTNSRPTATNDSFQPGTSPSSPIPEEEISGGSPPPQEPSSSSNDNDQPKIFDENTVRDILCGLGITCNRQFNDDLLVPADYSYSYQFKVRRVPSQLLKFKDFAPKVFQQIRQHWGISNEELLLSFRYENLLTTKGDGKSGAFFIFTKDKRFILKTSTGPERDFLWEMLPYYLLYIRKNPNTLLPRFFGVYSMKHEGIGGMVRFVVMNNWFNTAAPLSELYDLKGSTLGRSSGEDVKPGSILKDLDIKRKLWLDAPVKQAFLDQLYRDSQFLAQRNVMDYSLLIGIHYDGEEQRAAKMKKELEWAKQHTEDVSFRTLFQADENGIAGWNPDENRREIYFVGIIDILQRYTSAKKFEHLIKSIPFKSNTVSVVQPSYYAKRFHTFISNVTDVSPKCVSEGINFLKHEMDSDALTESEEEDDTEASRSTLSTTESKSKPLISNKPSSDLTPSLQSLENFAEAPSKSSIKPRKSKSTDGNDQPPSQDTSINSSETGQKTKRRKRKATTPSISPKPSTKSSDPKGSANGSKNDISESSEEGPPPEPTEKKLRSTKPRKAEVVSEE